MGKQISKLLYLTTAALLISLLPNQVHAYIGPGAGFAVAGSFLVMFTAILSALFVLLTWPIRYIVRAIRFSFPTSQNYAIRGVSNRSLQQFRPSRRLPGRRSRPVLTRENTTSLTFSPGTGKHML